MPMDRPTAEELLFEYKKLFENAKAEFLVSGSEDDEDRL
jgi:hypothetical protein